MNDENRCPQCGAELAADAPGELCPGCLLKRGLETGSFVTGEPTADYTPPTPDELAPMFTDLEIIEFIGRGGMGVVYKARQRRLDRLVALKILSPAIGSDPAFAERFTREAKAMAMLSHPNIVSVHDFGQTGGEGKDNLPSPTGRGAGGEGIPGGGTLYYFLMEYVDGLNLRQVLDAGTLAPEAALAVVPQICDALQYAHDHGVVHRDIKPENVLMDKEGRVKIADFGLAKLMGIRGSGLGAGDSDEENVGCVKRTNENEDDSGALHAPYESDLTAAGQVLGTPQYMAPEQIKRPLEVDHRADIYSLGVVFYQMLTGELPDGHFVPPSKKVQIDVRLDEVVIRAMEKEPQRRYQQANELKTHVETIVHTRPEASPGQRVSLIERVFPESGDWVRRFRSRWITPVHVRYGKRVINWRAAIFMSVAIAGAINSFFMLPHILQTLLGRSPPVHPGQFLAGEIISVVLAVVAMRWFIRWKLTVPVEVAPVEDKPPSAENGSSGTPANEPEWDWMMWAPFRSQQILDICSHMTAAEKREALGSGLMFGLWNAGTFFGPFFSINFLPSPLGWTIGAAILLFGLSFYPMWLRMNRRLMCSTAWARQQGITLDQLKSHDFSGGESSGKSSSRIYRVLGSIAIVLGMVGLPLSLMGQVLWGIHPLVSFIPMVVPLILGIIAWRSPLGKAAFIFSAFVLMTTGPVLFSITKIRTDSQEILNLQREFPEKIPLLPVPMAIDGPGGPWIAWLPRGVRVELVGVGEQDNSRWWTPDGSSLIEPPCELTGKSSPGNKSDITRAFYAKIGGRHSEPLGMVYKVIPSSSTAWFGTVKQQGKEVSNSVDFLTFIAHIPAESRTVSVRYGIGTGPWQDVASKTYSRTRSTSFTGRSGGLSKPIETKDGVVVVASDHLLTDQVRVIAIGEDGREFVARLECDVQQSVSETSSDGQSNTEKLRIHRATFTGLSLKQIKEIKLQSRSYEWVEFRNVALQPGQPSAGRSGTPGPGWSIVADGTTGDVFVISPEKREAVDKRIRREVAKQFAEAGASYDQLEVDFEAGTRGNFFDTARVRFRGLKGLRSADGTTSDNATGHFTMRRAGNEWHGQIRTLTFNVSTVDILGLPGRMEAGLPPPTAATLPGFGPVIERVVSVVRQTTRDCMIDLETGKLWSMPKALMGEGARNPKTARENANEWVRHNHIDATGQAIHTRFIPGGQAALEAALPKEMTKIGLVGIEMKALPADNADWDRIAPVELRRQLAAVMPPGPTRPGATADMTTDAELPATFLFETRDGSQGILHWAATRQA